MTEKKQLRLNRGSVQTPILAPVLYAFFTALGISVWDLPGWIPRDVGVAVLGAWLLFLLVAQIMLFVQLYREDTVTIEDLRR